MNILIACEYSGTVRDAFTARGHNALSCDILPTETPGKHYKGNVFDILGDGWDMLIAFPPCTYLSSAGLHFCSIEQHGKKAIERIKKRNKAIEFFLELYSAPIEKICLENPLGHISANILKPTQIIHPYYFGDTELKRTALWLRNLPPLTYSLENTLFETMTAANRPQPKRTDTTNSKKKRHYTDTIGNPKERAKFWPSIAKAMADQWG